MIAIQYAPTFIRMYKRLDNNLQEEVKEKIALFKDALNHKNLKVHKLKGFLENTHSFSVNYKIRIVFEYEQGDTVNLLYVGSHEQIYS
jgi:mRNA-degrading endonuclease YafQ of YafQ-DinJ toxin-antitoxin module